MVISALSVFIGSTPQLNMCASLCQSHSAHSPKLVFRTRNGSTLLLQADVPAASKLRKKTRISKQAHPT